MKRVEPGDLAEAVVDWRVLRTLLPYLAEFPARVALALGLLIGAKLASVALPMVLKHIVDALDADHHSLLLVPIGWLMAYGALRFFSVLSGELRDIAFGRVTERAMRRSALSVFRHLHGLDLDFHLSRRTGGLSRDIERGVSGISFLLRFMLFNIVPTLLEIALVAGILLFNYGVGFALIIALSIVLYVAFSVVVTEWRTRFVREANQLDSRAQTRAVDSLLNFETVRYFGNERFEVDEYDRFLAQWEVAQRRSRSTLSLLNAGQALLIAVAITAMMVLAAVRVKAGVLSLGDFVAINAYMIQLFIPLNVLGFVYREIRRALIDMGRMFGLLQQTARVADAADARPLRLDRAEVVFDRVSFAYDERRPILHEVSLRIAPGQKLAVVGGSGAGKSTLARLLFRFWDTTSGSVRIDGQDLRTVTQESLRAAIAVVPQDTVLFNDSLYYNVAYGRPGASAEDVDRAIRLAHLDDFVARLPEGLQTRVGERGLKLSGGEKQRVAIARALLKDPAILIFDEATSSLDSASEQAILQAIAEVAAQRTTLVIAHRLSTIVDADEIVVLDHGRVVERGRHAELLRADGAYARLWQMQSEHRDADRSSAPVVAGAE